MGENILVRWGPIATGHPQYPTASARGGEHFRRDFLL
jgi:hypothetical protein